MVIDSDELRCHGGGGAHACGLASNRTCQPKVADLGFSALVDQQDVLDLNVEVNETSLVDERCTMKLNCVNQTDRQHQTT